MRTGKLVWRFHTVPQPGEPGNDTWGPDGWKHRSGPSAWGLINVDVDRGMVLMSTGNPADSLYGGDRKGTNLYANCVLALDAATGKLSWHFQLTHHDIFDYDVPGGPALIQSNRKSGCGPDHEDGVSFSAGRAQASRSSAWKSGPCRNPTFRAKSPGRRSRFPSSRRRSHA